MNTEKIFAWPAHLFKDGILNMRIIMLGVTGILLIIGGGIFTSTSQNKHTDIAKPILQQETIQVNKSYEEYLEAKLSQVLTKVKGAGSIVVNVALDSSAVQEYERNTVKENKTTQEKDTTGGTRTTNEHKETSQVLVTKENGADHPVTVREVKPVVKGVIVIAEGALDSAVKANLIKAVEAGLGIPNYKITVLPKRR